MRILAVRGQNLASLAEPFELDLQAPPLEGCGLFAISGPTGAGKSTLLDALCLALFDRVPRLTGRSGPPVGRPEEDEGARIAAHDVRSLLRRGAGTGFAEVDFLGRDGRRYRARWSVRRAREKADGKPQAQELKLEELESRVAIGRGKKEVLAAIEERLGLSFDQFCRSALLAQGDFAAFLRAGADERAELLERITGTEIYSRLSIAAHERCREETLALEKLEAEDGALACLGDEARSALGLEESTRVEQVRAAETAQTRAREQLGWYEQRAAIAEALAKAEAEHAQAVAALEAGGAKKAELALARAAEQLRPQLEAADAAKAAHLGMAAQLETQEHLLAQVEEQLAQASVAERAAEQARAEAVQAEQDAGPALAEAERIDRELVAARTRAEGSASAQTSAAEAAEAARKALEGARAAKAEVEGAIALAQRWLEENTALDPVAAEWPRWKRELERCARGDESANALGKARLGQLGRLEAAQEALKTKRSALSAAEAKLEQARAELGRAEAEVAAAPVEAIRSQQDELVEARQRMTARLERTRKLLALERSRRSFLEDAAAQRGQAVALTQAAAEAQARATSLEPALAEARRALEAAKAAQDLGARRAELVDGAPCPLCGSTEHPFAKDAAFDHLVASQRDRVAELEQALRAATLEQQRGRAQAEAATKTAESAEARAAELTREIQQAAPEDAAEAGPAASRATRGSSAATRGRTSQATPSEDGGAGNVDVAALESACAQLEARQVELETRLAVLRAEAELRTQRAVEAQKKRTALTEALAAKEAAQQATVEGERDELELSAALKSLESELEQVKRTAAEARAQLATPLAGRKEWTVRLETGPAALLAPLERAVEQFAAQRRTLEEGERRLASLDGASKSAEAAAGETAFRLTHAAAAARTDAEEADRLARLRGQHFDGRPTAEVRRVLREALDAASQALEQKRSETRDRIQARALAGSALEALRAQERERALAEEEAAARLAASLAKAGLPEESARARLSRGPEWIATTEAALRAAEDREQATRVVRDERAERARTHEAAAPGLEEAEAAAAFEQARAELEQLQTALAETRAALRRDAQARAERADRLPRLEAQRQRTELWQGLDALIGSQSGKTFKIFAQSLTLDALLVPANAHLAELAPRYALMRVPGHALELQVVDRDMGEEVRSVNSLSGGESFLVSLALALGLAALSSEHTQVETLFIDEGFGTLDADSLELALATLDGLQAAGRQVGVISHVGGLAERIGTQVRVEKLGGGKSRVRVLGPEGLALEALRQTA